MASGIYEEEMLSAFLKSFPTYRLHRKPRSCSDGLWVFSSKDERYENNSYSSDDVGIRTMIYDKIKSVFSKMTYRYGIIVQFWAPVTIGGKLQLSTSGQPFASHIFYNHFKKYRRRCVEHVYDIGDVRGTPASAFLNCFPEIASIDPSVHHEVDSFLRNAFQECDLKTSFMMPIYCPFQTSSPSDCIGVIECSSWYNWFQLFNEMNMKIKEEGLSVYNVQDRIPYKTINGLKIARDQIQEALKIVCQSNHITVAQVWVASLDENHVHFSSSWEEAHTSRPLVLKLTGYKGIDEYCARNRWICQNYYDTCDLIPLQPGEQLILKTLQDYEPRFCKNISQLGTYKLIGWGQGDKGSRCLTICMRSIHTGEFNYVFEFLWKHNPFYPTLLEELLLKIKRCLPSFKFASGTEIGDKLRVTEIVASSKKIKKFNIFRLKKLSPIPEALKGGTKQVAVDYIVPLDSNCKTAPDLQLQQVIEQQIGTSTSENFLENIFGYGDLMVDCDDERLCEFLETLPSYILHKKPETEGALWVFCSEDKGSQNDSSSDDLGTRMIYDKIKSAFSKVTNRGELIVQFWAPVASGNRRILSTSGQPFAVSYLHKDLKKYRRLCVEHLYDIDVNSKLRGTPAAAFLNRFPEIIYPSVYAFQEECLETSFMIPICCHSQTSSSSDCIGVIECSSWDSDHLISFKEMNMTIKEVGLSVYNVQVRIPYKTINGLKLATDQIQEALKIVCQSHQIALAQVWIASDLDENHVNFSSFWEEAQTKRPLGLKLTGCIDEDSARNCWIFQDYYNACDLIPLQPGQELVMKTFQDYKPRFCKNISQLSLSKLMGWDRSAAADGSMGLTICMRSIRTGDFNYVFEFLWKHDSFYPCLLEEILLNIKRCLPSFKLASGTEIGDKLHVIDVDNSTYKEIKKIDIFQAKRSSRIPEALKEGKKQVGVDYMVPLDRNFKTAPVLVPQQVIEQQFGTSTTENFLENIFGNGNLMADHDDERLSEFLETLPTCILHKKPETEGALWVFCSKDEGSQKNLSSDDLRTRMIHDKIKSAFSKVTSGGELIVQFWAPVTSGNRLVLSTYSQPFAVSDFGEGLEEYRGRCVGYECNIDMINDTHKVIKEEIEHHCDGHSMTMISGPPTNAFLNHLPEAVLDTKNHREGSLMRYASDCGLWTSYTLPIGCPSQYYSSCIGVVECSSISSINLEIMNTMNRALEQEGLNVFNVQDLIPYNTINGLKLVRDEIQVALKSVCESLKIGVAQVWISYEDENHVPFSFSSEDDTQTTRRLALKLTGYNSVHENSTASHWRFKEYYDACDMVPLKNGEELVEKTLQDYQPRFCENISQLGTDMLMAWVSTDDVACSGFTICMSIDTGDFSCVFEFIWHHNPNYLVLLEALLLTLKRCLPRFNFASGAELGDQLHVIDVDNSTKSETKFYKIFKEKRLSTTMVVNYNARSKEKHDTTEIELSREEIEQHYGKTMEKAAKELGVSLSTLKLKHNILGMSGWQGPDLPQRKAYNSNKNQSKESHTHEKDKRVIQDSSPVKRNEKTVIKAEYADDKIKLHLGISEATFVTVENEIGKKFKLKQGTFKIQYLDEDEEWILMSSDQDLSDCIQNLRNVDRSAVRLRVLLHNQ